MLDKLYIGSLKKLKRQTLATGAPLIKKPFLKSTRAASMLLFGAIAIFCCISSSYLNSIEALSLVTTNNTSRSEDHEGEEFVDDSPASSTSACPSTFQLWPIFDTERQTILDQFSTGTISKEEAEEDEEPQKQQDDKILESMTACPHIFRPIDFFDNENSPGFALRNDLQRMIKATERTTCLRVGVHRYTFTRRGQKISSPNDYSEENDNNDDGKEKQEELHLVFNSVPKAASTSISKAMKNMDHWMGVTDHLDGKYHGMLNVEDMKHVIEMMEHERNVTKGRNSSSENHDTMAPSTSRHEFKFFGIMRDPVSRFVTATAQEMTLKTCGKRAVNFRKKCLKDNAKDTLQCALDWLKSRIIFGNETMGRIHYIPSAAIFYVRSFGHDLPIELYEMSALAGILNNFLVDGENLNLNANEKKADDGVVGSLSVSELSEDMIREICALYAVDVSIMRHLNMEDKYCKGHEIL